MNHSEVTVLEFPGVLWCIYGPTTETARHQISRSVSQSSSGVDRVVFEERFSEGHFRGQLESMEQDQPVAIVDSATYSEANDFGLLVSSTRMELSRGATAVAWNDQQLTPELRAIGLLRGGQLPSVVAMRRVWLACARGGFLDGIDLQVKVLEQLEGFVIIDLPRRPGYRTNGAAFEDLSSAAATLPSAAAIRMLCRLTVAGAPGWVGNAEAVLDILLRVAIRDVTSTKLPLAEVLVESAHFFQPASAKLSTRSREVIQVARLGDAQRLLDILRLRVVVAGHDLKFIEFALTYLPVTVEVRLDKWVGEKRHDPAASKALVNWADVIWVEWLAYCARWYSQNKSDRQVLIIRQHRYELLRDAADDIEYSRVDAVVAIAVHTMEALHERFGIPRSKLRVIPNIYESDRYRKADPDDGDRQFRIALVGSVPRLKGLHRSLEILSRLRTTDDRYTLTIFGRRPEELPWVIAVPDEAAYFEACQQFVLDNGLEDAVSYAGWVDIREELCEYGYVLSTSDLEGSHVSPGEAFLSGNLGVFLKWRGVEYIYPEEFGFSSPGDMAKYIESKPLSDEKVQRSMALVGDMLSSQQGVRSFLTSVQSIIRTTPA